ncbi:glycogen/starch/alpha-glucan phosphorylase, partial [Klebsiella michiganensis]|uniref:glycogen/starch/alpha-glucan phosphorylase n=1 Tax=Klebsiella michiganensis TaxID=1134687 RepID=UPI001E5FE00E
IELTGYWTWGQAQEWREAGVQQVVYHRSRDAQAAGVAWGDADNFFIFGNTAEEVEALRANGYKPRDYYEQDEELHQALTQIG